MRWCVWNYTLLVAEGVGPCWPHDMIECMAHLGAGSVIKSRGMPDRQCRMLSMMWLRMVLVPFTNYDLVDWMSRSRQEGDADLQQISLHSR